MFSVPEGTRDSKTIEKRGGVTLLAGCHVRYELGILAELPTAIRTTKMYLGGSVSILVCHYHPERSPVGFFLGGGRGGVTFE
jgi:hypothetical protein